MSVSIYFPCFIYFFRVWGVNWIDGGDACASQEQYRDLLFWLSSCYGAVHYWFYFSSLLLPLTFAFVTYLFLHSGSLPLSLRLLPFPSSSLSALILEQQVVICKTPQFYFKPTQLFFVSNPDSLCCVFDSRCLDLFCTGNIVKWKLALFWSEQSPESCCLGISVTMVNVLDNNRGLFTNQFHTGLKLRAEFYSVQH